MKFKLNPYILFLEKLFTVLSILWTTGGDDLGFLALIAYPTSLFFLLVRWKETIWKLIQEYFFWIYIGFLLISTAWAADFGGSIYLNLKLLGTIIIGISFGIRYSTKEQLQIAAWAFGIAIVLSIFYALFLPAKGLHIEGAWEGTWKGIYSHKNVLGRNMVLSTLIFYLQAISCKQYKSLMWIGVFLSFTLMILTTSATSLVMALTLLLLFPLYQALRWSISWLIPFLSMVVFSSGVAILFVVSQLESILFALGKDLTLSGRIPLWELIINKISERPWFGYGYGGFWESGWNGPVGDIWRNYEVWEVGGAHNGLLDIWLAVGLVGVIFSVIVFITVFFRSLMYLRWTKSADGIWSLWFLTMLVLSNMTESTFDTRSIMWVFFSAIVISTHRKTINLYDFRDIQSQSRLIS